MFSFRTTPLSEQLDKALVDGKVGCFCTQNSWNPETGKFLYGLFADRGNLKEIFSPQDTELCPDTNHILYSKERLEGLNAVVVEIQDIGTRYFNYTRDVFGLMEVLKTMDNPPSLYIVDHINPAGRVVEGTMPATETEAHIPKIAHRHGLTLGELANLYYSEIGAKYPLHVISALATESNRQLMPWTIAPASDIPGFFTCDLYSGGGLWNNTNVTPGIGTARPYEYIGAPFVKPLPYTEIPPEEGAYLRPCSFTPACGRYAGEKCFGYQIILNPGVEYHSFMHTLRLMRAFKANYPEFAFENGFEAKLSDPLLLSYLKGETGWNEAKEHIKVEEQKWMRKAKKFLLYEDQPYRIK
ncbi:MAG: exo-beta-N-acetylmuramidase NamZ domain-containing protein [Candidatus Cryptobacteroides sp.]